MKIYSCKLRKPLLWRSILFMTSHTRPLTRGWISSRDGIGAFGFASMTRFRWTRRVENIKSNRTPWSTQPVALSKWENNSTKGSRGRFCCTLRAALEERPQITTKRIIPESSQNVGMIVWLWDTIQNLITFLHANSNYGASDSRNDDTDTFISILSGHHDARKVARKYLFCPMFLQNHFSTK